MSWRSVARKDVRDASRSRTLWVLFGLFSVLFVGYAAAYTYVGDETFTGFVAGVFSLVSGLLPILGIVLGYRSIADDRADGSILLSMSFPQSRRDLLAGTVLGRVIVLLAPVLLWLSVAGLYAALRYGTDGALAYPWFLLVTALYGASFVAVAVALSASTTVDRRIVYGAVGAYLLLVVLWRSLVSFAVAFLHRFNPSVGTPDWELLLQLAEPGEAYARLLRAGFDIDRASQYVGEKAPAFVDWWAALIVIVLWIVVPLAIGYRQFEASDL